MNIAARAIAARTAAEPVRMSNKRTPQEFADEIRKRDTGTVASIFNTAMMIETSHEELGPALWLIMILDELKWSKSKGYAFLKIAQCDHLTSEEVQHVALPSDWGVLVALARLTSEQFQKGVDTGIIRAGMERKDIKELKPAKPKTATPKQSTAKGDPRTGDEWQSFLWTGLSKAAASLKAQDRCELFSVIRQHIDNLERKLNDEGAF